MADCRAEAAALQKQLRAAYQDFQAVLEVFDEIITVVTLDLPAGLPALRKHASSIEDHESAFLEQKSELASAKSTHKGALATGGAVSDLSRSVGLRFYNLCSDYADQEPYVAAYNLAHGNQFQSYMPCVVALRDLRAQTLTVGTAKQIVTTVKHADLAVRSDPYLKEFKYWFDESACLSRR